MPILQPFSFQAFASLPGGAYTPAAKTLHKMTPIPKIEENTMNDTLNPEASATIIAPEAAESAEASIPTETPQHSPKRRDNRSRCHYRYPNGRRCTLPGLPAKSGLCLRHYNRQVAVGLPLTPVPDDFADLSEDLLYGPLRFSSAEALREYLTRLLTTTTKGRISPRRASVLAYITTQLLHSHCVVQKEEKELDNQPQEIIFDLPRPQRDEPEDPERALYKSMARRCTPVAAPADSDADMAAIATPDKTR